MLGGPRVLGVALSLGSGLAFAIQPVLGQLALDEGAAISALLGWRYAIAAVVLALVAGGRLMTMPLQVAASAFGLGVVLYAADSALFYAALDRTSAPFATLLHYAHLLVVVGIAVLVGRERLGARRGAVLAAVLVGVALVGGGGGATDAVGMALALASACAYATYILVSDRLMEGTDPVSFAALLVAGAATSFLVFGTSRGELASVGGGVGVGVLLVGALVGTVFALSAFLGAIRLLGPGTASLLVTVEAPAGVALAALVLGQRLALPQLAGAALVLGAIVLLQIPIPRRRRVADVRPLPVTASPEPASALAA